MTLHGQGHCGAAKAGLTCQSLISAAVAAATTRQPRAIARGPRAGEELRVNLPYAYCAYGKLRVIRVGRCGSTRRYFGSVYALGICSTQVKQSDLKR